MKHSRNAQVALIQGLILGAGLFAVLKIVHYTLASLSVPLS